MDDITMAFALAQESHGDQMYGDKPYIYHLQEVLRLCQEAGMPIEYQIVAILHDVVEDTDCPSERIKRLFGHVIWEAVNHITHLKNEDYFNDYLPKVKENDIAKNVKLFDLLSNLEHAILKPNRYGKLIKKYQKALFVLMQDSGKVL